MKYYVLIRESRRKTGVVVRGVDGGDKSIFIFSLAKNGLVEMCMGVPITLWLSRGWNLEDV